MSEETIDKPNRVPPPAKKKAKPRTKKSGSSSKKQASAKSVKIVAKAEKTKIPKPGKSVIEQDVIKYCCPRCNSERVAETSDAQLTCGLCGTAMKLVS